MAAKMNGKTAPAESESGSKPLKCGLIMPISSSGEYTEAHWAEVLSIISDAVASADLDASLVSFADETTVIPKTIVQNLYDTPLVICDVSGKNANVMFELGLRLAFDKPTIIVKDDKTTFSFDTGSIEHLLYPRDLRYTKIVEFKIKLAEKVRATLKAAEEPDYSTFLKHFGKFTVAKLDEKELPQQEFILEELRAIRQSIVLMAPRVPNGRIGREGRMRFNVDSLDGPSARAFADAGLRVPGVIRATAFQSGSSSEVEFEIEHANLDNVERSLAFLYSQGLNQSRGKTLEKGE